MTSKDGFGILHYAVLSSDTKIVTMVLNAMKQNNCSLNQTMPTVLHHYFMP